MRAGGQVLCCQLHIHDFLNMNNYVVKDALGGKASKLFPGFQASLGKQIVKLLFFIAWLQNKKEEKSYYRRK